MKKLIVLCLLVSLAIACNNDESTNTPTPGSLNLVFQNTIDASPLVMNDLVYTNTSNENYGINELKYIISNITLIRLDDTEYIYPVEDSYFLIDEEGNKTASLVNIPADTYKAIKFGFGVDPTKYPIESGTLNFVPLAEEADMLWSWSAGYKFIKFEGNYSVNSGSEIPFLYHVGSHGATLDNYKEIIIPVSNMVIQSNGENDNITERNIQFDIAKIFDSIHTLSLEAKNEIMVDPENAPKIAENISTAFSISE